MSKLFQTPKKLKLEDSPHFYVPRTLTFKEGESSTSYSLERPPQAPKKRKPSLAERRGCLDKIPKLELSETEAERRQADWQALVDSGRVRQEFLTYTLEDLEEIDDVNKLYFIYTIFLPSLKDENFIESALVSLLFNFVDKKLFG